MHFLVKRDSWVSPPSKGELSSIQSEAKEMEDALLTHNNLVEPVTTFHKYPLGHQDILEKWLIKINRENFTPTTYSRICSKHFTHEDFNEDSSDSNVTRIGQMTDGKLKKRYLRSTAIPSIFPGKLLPKPRTTKMALSDARQVQEELTNDRLIAEFEQSDTPVAGASNCHQFHQNECIC